MFSVDGSEAPTGSLMEDPSELLRSSAGTVRGHPTDWLTSSTAGRSAGAAGPAGPATLGFLGRGGAAAAADSDSGALSTLNQSSAFSFGVGAASSLGGSAWRPDASGGTARSGAAADGGDLDAELQESVVRCRPRRTKRTSLFCARLLCAL